MLLDLGRPVQAESIPGLPLQAFIYEIGGLQGPALRQLVSLDLDLLGEDHVSDFFAAATDVGSATEHELVADDSNSEVVDRVAVILAAHHFGRHVSGCARRVAVVFGAKNFGDSHVSDPHIAVLLHYDVLRFDVAMNDALVVHVFEA